MPRNRMIKPEFCSDGKLGKLSRDARLLFILLWMHSDDYGVISSNERFILGNCFENDETVTNQMLRKWLNELCDLGFLVRFNSDYKDWYKIKNWEKHQKVDKPSKRRNPVFTPKTQEIEHSRKALDCLATDSEINLDERERERERESIRERERGKIYTNDFEALWIHWSNNIKNGSNKKSSFDKFKKLSKDDQILLFDSIQPYSISNKDQNYLKRCETYINQRHWEQAGTFAVEVRQMGDF